MGNLLSIVCASSRKEEKKIASIREALPSKDTPVSKNSDLVKPSIYFQDISPFKSSLLLSDGKKSELTEKKKVGSSGGGKENIDSENNFFEENPKKKSHFHKKEANPAGSEKNLTEKLTNSLKDIGTNKNEFLAALLEEERSKKSISALNLESYPSKLALESKTDFNQFKRTSRKTLTTLDLNNKMTEEDLKKTIQFCEKIQRKTKLKPVSVKSRGMLSHMFHNTDVFAELRSRFLENEASNGRRKSIESSDFQSNCAQSIYLFYEQVIIFGITLEGKLAYRSLISYQKCFGIRSGISHAHPLSVA